MSSKETSVADLKRAIDRVTEYRKEPLMVQLACSIGFTAAARDAWRAAFEWRDSMINCSDASSRRGEYLEGMRLIREKLK